MIDTTPEGYPKTTSGPSQNYSINYMQLGAQQGWQCPICKRVLSPWTPECPCKGQGMETWTTTTSEGTDTYIPKTVTLNDKEISNHIPNVHTYYSEAGLEK